MTTAISCSEYLPIANWSDRMRDADRYIKIWVPEHPAAFCGGWVYEHRLVAERTLGRLLQPGEQVHHLVHRRDNRPEALVVVTEEEHHKAHGRIHQF